MKKYRITCSTNSYHASRSKRYEGMEILQYDGATPIKWVHNDNYGDGFTLNEGRHILRSYAGEDSMNSGEKNTHRFFEMSYQSDVYLYRIEEF